MLGGGENKELTEEAGVRGKEEWVGERSLSRGSCLGEVREGEEEEEDRELSEERFSSVEIGEKAEPDLSACLWLADWMSWAWWARRPG